MAEKGKGTGKKTTANSPAVKKTGGQTTRTAAAGKRGNGRKRTTSQAQPAKSEGKKRRMTEPVGRFGDTILDEVILILIIVVCAVIAISQVTNKMGVIGNVFGTFFQGILGIGGLLLPVLVIVYCIWLLCAKERSWPIGRAVGGTLFLLTIASAAYLFHPVSVSAQRGVSETCATLFSQGALTNGGLIGGLIGGGLFQLLDALGSVMVLLALLVISVILMTGRSFFGAVGTLADHQKMRKQRRNEKIKNRADRIRQTEKMEAEQERKREETRKRRMTKEDFNIELEEGERKETPEIKETVFRKKKQDYSIKKREPIYDFVKESQAEETEPKREFNVVFGGKLREEDLTPAPVPETKSEPMQDKVLEPDRTEAAEDIYEAIFGTGTEAAVSEGTSADVDWEAEVSVLAAEAWKAAEEKVGAVDAIQTEHAEEMPETGTVSETMDMDLQATQEGEDAAPMTGKTVEKEAEMPQEMEEKPYQFPPMDLLGKDPGTSSGGSKLEMIENAKKLESTLKSFGVDAKVIQINKGPTVTRYELSPSQGVKVSKIVNLADDIALNLAASGIRIEAPIPGKAAVGIEVPNRETQSVYLRTVLESDAFQKHPSKLAFALGEDITGNPVVTDIAKMPHLLIAGATGSGKSVCINTLITSILYKASPKEVKLLLVDPKVVELSVYNGIPHLLIPVVTDPKKASAALNWAVREMLQRYNDFAACGVRDIKGFNAMKEEQGEPEAKMSQIVIIIDELADLMMAAPGEVEDAICRLAQMARAAGMHLIIATQRPSVDVITGVIKANIPSRLAFAVSSGIDSRTILDMVGAEKLLGKGDMLFYPSGQAKPARMQGAFVTDKEVERIVDFLRKNSRPGYTQEMVDRITSSPQSAAGGEETDEHYEQAVELILEKEKASVSMLQRQFRIGYNRAARLMDELERRGMVGPEEGSKPRKVLITREEWNAMQQDTQQESGKI